MKAIDELFERLDNTDNVDEIRFDIANLIAKSLTKKRGVIDYWEKAHFDEAIALLGANSQAVKRDSVLWLKLCLRNIINAHTPPNERNEDAITKDPRIESLTVEHLIKEVRNLGGRL